MKYFWLNVVLVISLFYSTLGSAQSWTDKLSPSYQKFIGRQIEASIHNISHYESLPESQLKFDAVGYAHNAVVLRKAGSIYLIGLIGPTFMRRVVGVTRAGSIALALSGFGLRFVSSAVVFWQTIEMLEKSLFADSSKFMRNLVVRDGHPLALSLTESPSGYQRLIELSRTEDGRATLRDVAYQSAAFYKFLTNFGLPKFDWQENATQL